MLKASFSIPLQISMEDHFTAHCSCGKPDCGRMNLLMGWTA